MKKDQYYVIGVMSGTSLDGIDLAYVFFKKEKNWRFRLLHTLTVPYSEVWKEKLSRAISFSDKEINSLNIEYTAYLSQIISAFISEKEITQLDAVCSHGHTIFHNPEAGHTLQIGNLSSLRSLLKKNGSM